MHRLALPLALLLSSSVALGQVRFGNDRAITPARLKAHLEFIASDELEGRMTPSRGLDIATMYVATQLKLWGAKPAGDNGTYFQRLKFTEQAIDQTKSFLRLGGKSYSFGEGFKGVSASTVTSGKMVYAGHGYSFKKKGIDPYAGLDLKGKILVVASGLPKGATYEDMQGAQGVDYLWPALAAEKLGAVAVLTIPDPAYLAGWKRETFTKIGALELQGGFQGSGKVANIHIGPALAAAIFQGEQISADEVLKGVDAPEKGFALSDSKTVNLNIVDIARNTYANNVVAIVPGTDPKLKSEYVAYGAHIDHVGIHGDGKPGDHIFNGADDDGSGTVAILEIAHALLTGARPKRSSIFIWHVGEEQGLWGSVHFVENPTVPLNKIVAQLNLDMIGRSKRPGDTKPENKVLTGPNEIYVVGSTKMSTDLQKASESTNSKFLKLKFNYKYDDPKDTEQIFYRSDHYSYAAKGIPIIFYFDGVHEDYHQPGDEVSKIDFIKVSRVARTVLATGWTLANAAKRPVVDKPLKQ